MTAKKRSLKKYFFEPLWDNNQILVAVLGICSALAITVSMRVALTMALAVSFVTGCSSFFVSLFRKQTPDSVRMIAQLVFISLFVIIVDQFLQAYFFSISKILSVFVGLIITNCLVMGRAEAMAKNVKPIPALLDGLAAGLGYGMVILTVAFVRELFGFGTIFGFQVIPDAFYASEAHPNRYQNIGLMPLAPAAFFIIGFMIWIANNLNRKRGS
jgi:Na+-transporting NADH:ubiquinone oxidoreductase subunit D